MGQIAHTGHCFLSVTVACLNGAPGAWRFWRSAECPSVVTLWRYRAPPSIHNGAHAALPLRRRAAPAGRWRPNGSTVHRRFDRAVGPALKAVQLSDRAFDARSGAATINLAPKSRSVRLSGVGSNI